MLRLWLGGVFAALALAAPAQAANVNLWECHGMNGGSLVSQTLTFGSSETDIQPFGGGCSPGAGGYRVTFTSPTPVAGFSGGMEADVPAGLTLKAVRIERRAMGPGYFAETSTGPLESETAGTLLTAPFNGPATGTYVKAGLRCPAACAGLGNAFAELTAIGLTVDDPSAPTVTVSGSPNPVAGQFSVTLDAADAGVGLYKTVATLDGAFAATASYPSCADATPGDGTIDLAYGTVCPATAHWVLPVDATGATNGSHRLELTVTDGAGNVTPREIDITVANPVTPQATPTPTPVPTAVPTAVPTPEPTPTPGVGDDSPTTEDAVTIPNRIVALSSRVSFTVSCPKAAKARCTLRFTAAGKRLATGSGSIAPGHRGKITLTLTAAAKRSLQRHKTLKGTLSLYEGTKRRPGVTVTLRLR